MGRRILGPLCYVLTIVGVLVAAQWGSYAATALAESNPLSRNCCFVIDPGHGGEDGGATSCTGRTESSFNLDISLRLRDLMALLGCSTRMIRTTDTAVYTSGKTIAQKKSSDLKERVRIVEETAGAVLLSIHQNYFSDSRYSGAQVFYADTPGSKNLAESLQSALVSALNPGSHRKSKQCDGVYLMDHITGPGVLIECGFLSNPAEEALLRSSTYQKQLCCVIATVAAQNVANT